MLLCRTLALIDGALSLIADASCSNAAAEAVATIR